MNAIQQGLDGQITDPQAARLWQRLRTLRFDGGTGPRTFAVRLAQEQGWSAAYTARAVEEYRRFLLLFALEEKSQREVGGQPGQEPGVQIVPPATVDKVWHLHLLYTRSYWEELCQGILGLPLHHLPADGTTGDAAALNTVYRQTLASYRRVFGVDAPADIWPGGGTPARSVAALPPIAPRVTLSKPPAPPPRAPSMPWGWRVFWIASLGGLALLVLAEAGWSSGVVMGWLLKGSLVLGVVASMILAASAEQDRERQRERRGRGMGDRSGDGGGWNFDYSGVGSGGEGGHSAHGSHDAGGHSHACGGHSCGGHGCGGGH